MNSNGGSSGDSPKWRFRQSILLDSRGLSWHTHVYSGPVAPGARVVSASALCVPRVAKVRQHEEANAFRIDKFAYWVHELGIPWRHSNTDRGSKQCF